MTSTNNTQHWRSLNYRSIYILPTRYGLMFMLMLVALLLVSMNYGLSLGYGLTYLLGSVAFISILHTYRNLAKLQLQFNPPAPTFNGQDGELTIQIYNPTGLSRFAIEVRQKKERLAYTDLINTPLEQITIPVHAQKRGWITLDPITLYTNYPLGLFFAWSKQTPPHPILVYPKPASEYYPLPSYQELGSNQKLHAQNEGYGEGSDDFFGLRSYQLGDSLNHVAWKQEAKGQGLYTKQFKNEERGTLWLSWDQLDGLPTETRLSVLCRWVLECSQKNIPFGLSLPKQKIAENTGLDHQNSTLKALAIYTSITHN